MTGVVLSNMRLEAVGGAKSSPLQDTYQISWMLVRGDMYTQSSAVFKSKELPVQIIIILSNRQK